jgi:hypothetical protein
MNDDKKGIVPLEMLAVGVLAIACFALGWATPFGTVFVALLVAALLFDVFLGGEGSATEGIARGIGVFWRWAFAPIDLNGSSPSRVWMWRLPASAVIFGFLLQWGENLAVGAT